MKKIFALIITLFYLAANSALAFSELYYLKNTNETTINPLVANAFSSQNFQLIKTSPYYGVSYKNNQDYAVVILQQSGQNMFYYYQSNDNKKINNTILKGVKNYGIVYEQSYNTNIINIYDNLAQKLMSQNDLYRYNFDDEEEIHLTPVNKTQTVQPTTYSGYVAQVTAGTKLNTYLQNSINTATAQKGDQVIVVLTDDLKYNGYTIAPQGSLIYGTLTTARHATYGSRNGRVVIEFNQLVTPDNRTYSISTEKVDFTVTNDGKVAGTVKSAVTGAVVGALLGLLVGAMSSSTNIGTSTAIGAGVGAGGALIGATAEHGVDAEIPSFTELELTLTKPFNATVSSY
ncbi:TrbI/VirB10 family protein [bacterium]|nr:TrbI/VirB10 family protein [bacterium]